MARFTNGWVKIHRKLLFDPKFDCYDRLILIWLIGAANIEESHVMPQGSIDVIKISRGQLLTSISEIARDNRLSRKVVKNRLEKFEKMKMVEQQRTSKGNKSGTIITILNYSKYQDNEISEGQQRDNKRAKAVAKAVAIPVAIEGTRIEELKNSRIKEDEEIKNKELNNISAASGSAPNAKNLIAFYCEKYKQRFGVNPVITGKESGAVRNILKSMSYEKAQEIITDYFDLSDAWIVQRMYALSILQDASVINRIQAKRQGVDVTRQRSLEYEKQTEYSKITEKFLKEYENAKISKNT